MTVEIKVPPLGESISEGVVAQILKPNNTFVEKDEEIIEIETDKINQPLYAPETGVLTLTVKEGDTLQIGQVIGSIAPSKKPEEKPKQEEKASPSSTKPQEKRESQEKAPHAESPPPPKQPAPGVARRFPEDTLKAAPLPNPDEEPSEPKKAFPVKESKKEEVSPKDTQDVERRPMSALRKTVARRLLQATQETAMLTTFNEVDMSAVIAFRNKEKKAFEEKHGVRLGFMSFFIKAAVQALKAVPEVNGAIEGEDLLYYQTYHVGVAVSTDRGLMVPVIRECDKRSFAEIEKQLDTYAKQARSGRIPLEALGGGSFTITNGGVFGSLLSTPILNPPQSGVLGMHNIVKRPVVIDDKVVVRPMMYLALSYDHRIVDGKGAITFLVNIKENLEDPARLLLEF